MSTSIATTFVVLAAACFPLAAGRAQGTPATPDSSPPRIVRLASPVDVPMLNVGTEQAPLPGVEVMVNGRGPFRFGIETGARFLIITADAAQRAGLGSVSSGATPELHADSITIGQAMLGDVHLTVLPRAPRGVDGLLGLPAFQNLLLTIDYPRARVRLEQGSLPQADGQTILPLSRAAEFWALPVSYAGHVLATILDTRSTGAFSLDPRDGAALPWKEPPVIIGRAGGAGIPTTEVKGGALGGEAVVGRYHITEPNLTLHQLPPDYPSEPRIGAVVLKNFTLTPDQVHGRLRLLRDGPPTFALPNPGRVP